MSSGTEYVRRKLAGKGKSIGLASGGGLLATAGIFVSTQVGEIREAQANASRVPDLLKRVDTMTEYNLSRQGKNREIEAMLHDLDKRLAILETKVK